MCVCEKKKFLYDLCECVSPEKWVCFNVKILALENWIYFICGKRERERELFSNPSTSLLDPLSLSLTCYASHNKFLGKKCFHFLWTTLCLFLRSFIPCQQASEREREREPTIHKYFRFMWKTQREKNFLWLFMAVGNWKNLFYVLCVEKEKEEEEKDPMLLPLLLFFKVFFFSLSLWNWTSWLICSSFVDDGL